MPIYTFNCKKCNKEVDRKLPLSEYKTPQKCDECKTIMEKMVALPSHPIFNGMGWTEKFHRK